MYVLKDVYQDEVGISSLWQSSDSIKEFFKGFSLFKVHKFLTITSYKLGKIIALYPSYFIIIPVFLSLLAITGIQRMHWEDRTEYLFYPDNGRATEERAVIEHYFPMNSSSFFVPYHITRVNGFARVLIEAKDNQTIFRKFIWDEVLELDKKIRDINITYNEKVFTYYDVCASYNKKCSANSVLELYDEIDAIEQGTFKINYPIMIFPLVLPMFFGGITLGKNELYIESAKALNLAYFLRVDTEEDKERAALWEKEFITAVGKLQFQNLHVSRSAARSLQDSVNETPVAIKPYIPIVAVVMLFFSVGNTMMLDVVRSKFYLGIIGLISATLATSAAFGLLMYLGVSNVGINNIIPFLMIGIGLDDMFVMLAAWRRTPVQDSVAKRLGNTYAEAGVSILITSLTNMISFLIGITTPMLAIRLFCLYTAICILFMYLLHMTFFGGCLAAFGYLEKNQRNSFFCTKAKAKSQLESEGGCYPVLCSGGINPKDPWNMKDNQHHVVMLFFKNHVGRILTKKYVKCIVFGMFAIYICGSIYGCYSASDGYDRKNSVRYDSYIVDYIDMEDRLFRHHPYQIQVVITGDLMYSNKTVRKQIIDLHKSFESLPFVAGPALTQSWLRGWFIRLRRKSSLANITTEAEFIKELRETYLYGKDNVRMLDVAFSDDLSRILASRFILQTKDLKDANADSDMMIKLRETASQSPLNVTVFNPNFVYFDQYTVVKSVIIQSTAYAAVAMILICLIFIPNRWCALHVGFSIVSIEIGVIGYMSLWNVNLDYISMVTLIMCIGFSVDFSAHVSFSYLTSKAKNPDEKIKECLFCLGLPILQGGLSTLFSVMIFIVVPSYVYVAFFKVIFLVVIFAAMHGLFVIPVLLSVAGPDVFQKYNKKTQYLDNVTSNSNHQSQGGKRNSVDKDNGIIQLNIDKGSFDAMKNQQERDDPEGCSNEGFSIVEGDDKQEHKESSDKCEKQSEVPETVQI